METIPDIRKTIATPMGVLTYYSLPELARQGYDIEQFPFSIRILLENIIRNFNGFSINKEHFDNILGWKPKPALREIPFLPARVLMQDFTGVPSIVDIASIRSEMARKGRDPRLINPRVPVDLIIDHSVQVDFFGNSNAYRKNVELEYSRNHERYSLLKWAQSSFGNFRVLAPGMGICHQVNLEFLSQVITARDGMAFPDTLVGTDSHTPMVNGIGVIAWGVGGIEAEAVMLGQPTYIMLPEVIGLRLSGKLGRGATATDLVLTIAELLRKTGVVGKFVEVFGNGLNDLTVPDRATISNMSPEFGCTVTYFPPDHKTLEYLRNTGRDPKHIQMAEACLKSNLLWRENEEKIRFTEVLDLDLSGVEPAIAGPKRPQDRIPLTGMKGRFIDLLQGGYERKYVALEQRADMRWLDEGGSPGGEPTEAIPQKKTKDSLKSSAIHQEGEEMLLSDGSVVIAAITSCTNTSNPSVMLGAGLLAKKAVERGLLTMPWVKTSLAPGSKVVTTYLERAQLMPFLEKLGFYLVGYGCTTCIGNSGPLPSPIADAITGNELVVSAVLSGNRNFEARIHPLVKMNFLASPPLVVAYALAGRIDIDFDAEPLGTDTSGNPVYLKDIWPYAEEVNELMSRATDPADYVRNYESIFRGDNSWEKLKATASDVYHWDVSSTYLKEAPFFKDLPVRPPGISDIRSARVLLKLGDSITTDHISPAGSIGENSPAGLYLRSLGIEKKDFNSYGSRRGNHEVMIRGTFANVRLKNELVDKEGGWTIYHPDGRIMPVYDAAMEYGRNKVPLVIVAGLEYGSGSSRDWAAKGVALLGVRAILARSFERIHRSNLVGMGIMPLQFKGDGEDVLAKLKGDESFDISGLTPNKEIHVTAVRPDGTTLGFDVIAMLDSLIEVAYYQNGGILQYVLRSYLDGKGGTFSDHA